MGLLAGILIILFCCIVIWRASDGFEVASEYLGRNLSDGVRGATINAIGSSMPELFTTLFFFIYYAYFIHDPELANDGFAGGVGTTAGSAVFNGMIIPAVVILAVIGMGMVNKVEVSRKVILRDGLSLIAVEICLILLISGTTLYWWHGLMLMFLYSIYVIIMFSTMSEKTQSEEEDDFYENDSEKSVGYNLLSLNLAPVFIKKEINTQNAWTLLLMAMLIIGVACFFLVFACELTAQGLGINTYFVAVILAAAATSVPDTILSYRDAMDGEYDDAVANALGSNIFDVCFALGFPLFLFTLLQGPITMSAGVVADITELWTLLFLLTVLAFLIYYIGKGMGRIKAYLLLSIYLLFAFYIFSKAYEQEWAVWLGGWLQGLF